MKKGKEISNMRKDLIDLLNIYGVSGREGLVRKYLQNKLSKNDIEYTIDLKGNLLADIKVGSGEGATVILSAHMDTVKSVQKDRKLLGTSTDTISSSKGALGADDRAGIAIILSVIDAYLNDEINFDGNIKLAFSVEEETGLVGAEKIDTEWYKDSDLAIIVDRRGNSDIVVGCFDAFCSNEVGYFAEDVASLIDDRWECVEGGISDAYVFSSNGINSINLSAGYYNEHTDREYVVVSEMFNTRELVISLLENVNESKHLFGKVPASNEWVLPSGTYGKYGNYDYYEDGYINNDYRTYSDDYLYEDFDDVELFMYGNRVYIYQGDNEILMSEDTLEKIYKKVKNSKIKR